MNCTPQMGGPSLQNNAPSMDFFVNQIYLVLFSSLDHSCPGGLGCPLNLDLLNSLSHCYNGLYTWPKPRSSPLIQMTHFTRFRKGKNHLLEKPGKPLKLKPGDERPASFVFMYSSRLLQVETLLFHKRPIELTEAQMFTLGFLTKPKGFLRAHFRETLLCTLNLNRLNNLFSTPLVYLVSLYHNLLSYNLKVP